MAEPIRTLLIVDDDQDLREHLTNVFSAQGYAVLTAPNGARALDILAHVPSRCLVLSDLTMPVMTGWDFVVELQNLPNSATRFPVVIISGSDLADAWRLPGVVQSVSKPLQMPKLIELVNEECNAFIAEPSAA